MISAVRAAQKSGFLWVRLGCGDIHALKRRFILTISPSRYAFTDAVFRAVASCGNGGGDYVLV